MRLVQCWIVHSFLPFEDLEQEQDPWRLAVMNELLVGMRRDRDVLPAPIIRISESMVQQGYFGKLSLHIKIFGVDEGESGGQPKC
jgi:hypothetical protein